MNMREWQIMNEPGIKCQGSLNGDLTFTFDTDKRIFMNVSKPKALFIAYDWGIRQEVPIEYVYAVLEAVPCECGGLMLPEVVMLSFTGTTFKRQSLCLTSGINGHKPAQSAGNKAIEMEIVLWCRPEPPEKLVEGKTGYYLLPKKVFEYKPEAWAEVVVDYLEGCNVKGIVPPYAEETLTKSDAYLRHLVSQLVKRRKA